MNTPNTGNEDIRTVAIGPPTYSQHLVPLGDDYDGYWIRLIVDHMSLEISIDLVDLLGETIRRLYHTNVVNLLSERD